MGKVSGTIRNAKIRSVAVCLAASLGAALALSACGTSGAASTKPPASTKSNKKFTIGYVLAAPVTALVSMGKGLKVEANKLGMTVVTASANFTSTKQLEAVNSMISRHVNAIVTTALNPKAFEGAITSAKKAGIPILLYGGAVPGDAMNLANPDYQTAYNAVTAVKSHLASEGKPCNIAVIQGPKIAPPIEARDTAFLAAIKTDGCKLVATQITTKTTTTSAATIVDQWKTQYGSEIQAILPYNDTIALGILSATSPTFNPLVVGFNGSPQDVKEVANGSLWRDYGLENALMGEGFAYAAHRLLTGHKLPATVVEPYVTITKSNAANYHGDSYFLAHPPKVLTIVQQTKDNKKEWVLEYKTQ